VLPKLNPIRVTEKEPDDGIVELLMIYSSRGAEKETAKEIEPRGAPFEI